MSTTKWFLLMTVLAFGSVISFFQINSYQADKHHLNTFWPIVGVVLGLAAIYCLSKVAKQGGTPNS